MPDLSIHPAAPSIRTLERFGIPFAAFSREGRQTYLSGAARELLDPATPRATQLWRQVGVAVATGRTGTFREHFPDGSRFSVTLRAVPDGGEQFAVAAVLCPVATPDPGGTCMADLGLTRREVAVARLIALGLSNKEVGAELGISIHTARRHTERIYQKLGVSSRSRVAHLLASRVGYRAAVA